MKVHLSYWNIFCRLCFTISFYNFLKKSIVFSTDVQVICHYVSVQGLIWRVRVFHPSAASTRHILLFLYIAFEYEGSGNFSLRGWQMVRFLYSPRRWSEWQAALSQSVQREAHPDFWFSSHYPPPAAPPARPLRPSFFFPCLNNCIGLLSL